MLTTFPKLNELLFVLFGAQVCEPGYWLQDMGSGGQSEMEIQIAIEMAIEMEKEKARGQAARRKHESSVL